MKVRKLILAAASAALAVSALAVPASASTTPATVWVAHGIPGAVVDVCVGGSEVRSNFKYGRTFKLSDVTPGTYRIRVFLADSRTCKGTKVIDREVTLTDGLNATAVAWLNKKGAPALKIFVNDVAINAYDAASVTVRHVAKAPAVDVYLSKTLNVAGFSGGPTIPNFKRGASAGPVEVEEAMYAWWVTAAGTLKPVIGPATGVLRSGDAYQILAVGTSAKNYRFIVIGQPGMVTT
jgi:hypothetical protein